MPRGHKGAPRTPGSGRQKGTPNKYSQNLMGICRDKGLDVFEALVEIALDPINPDRFQSLKELGQYLYPKRKSLEHSGEINTRPYEGLTDEELTLRIEAARRGKALPS